LIRESDNYQLKLMAPLDLLKRWATVNNFVANTEFIEYYTDEEDIKKFIEKFKDISSIEYAFTGLSGAMLAAPYVRPVNVHVYVKTEEDAKKIAKHLNLLPIEANGNVKFPYRRAMGFLWCPGDRWRESCLGCSALCRFAQLSCTRRRGGRRNL